MTSYIISPLYLKILVTAQVQKNLDLIFGTYDLDWDLEFGLGLVNICLLSSSGPGQGPRSGPGQVPGQVQKVQGPSTKDLDLG